jgi:drug/metabolite transporter (DMT)-like permease
MPRSLAMLCLISAMALTGANVPLAKILAQSLPTEVLLVLRFALASLVLALLAPVEPGQRLRTLPARDWAIIAVLALLGSVGFTWALVEGVQRTSAASAGIILAGLPAVVALVGLAMGERLGRGELLMVALAVAGVALVQGQVSSPAGTMGSDVVGNLLIGLAVACEAAFVIAARGISRRLAPLRLSLGVALVSLGASLPLGLIGIAHADLSAVEPRIWALLGWYTLTASVVCTALWYAGAGHVEAWAAGLATAAVPVAALVVAVAVLGERLTPLQVLGAMLVIVSIAVGTLSKR